MRATLEPVLINGVIVQLWVRDQQPLSKGSEFAGTWAGIAKVRNVDRAVGKKPGEKVWSILNGHFAVVSAFRRRVLEHKT